VCVVAVVLLLAASATMTTTLAVVRAHADQYFNGMAANLGWGSVYLLLPLVISFAVFLLAYRLIPNHRLDWGDLWVGALLAALGFELVKALFGLYLVTFAQYDRVYGTLGGVIAFLVFVFLVANITIFAAEISSELAQDHQSNTSDSAA
jgi:membrane protein